MGLVGFRFLIHRSRGQVRGNSLAFGLFARSATRWSRVSDNSSSFSPCSLAAPFFSCGLRHELWRSAAKSPFVRFGSLADIMQCNSACPLTARSGHYLILSEVYLHGRKAGKA